ncbi:hypothetical protein SO802_017755 [Lithocarpus litseifolius]|uniref:Uncharacterized protein n=1 Tax=Lithocarpus litseifolius TaxID=425828 RepID=A0AAW2CKU1_9ROSI
MTTRFSKQKLAEAHEKKARSALVSGLLARKRLKVGNASKDDPVVTPPFAHSLAKHSTSPTSSLEVIASTEEGTEKKKALGESLFISRKLLDFEKGVAIAEPVVKSLSAENEALKNKVAILDVKAEKDKEPMTTLEKSLQEFKEFDSYSDDLCEYYVEGFELFRKWMVMHHSNLDLSNLVMGEVEKELLANRSSKVTAKNVMEETTTIADVMERDMTIAPADQAS